MELCFLFFVVEEEVTFLNNAMFSLVLLLGLVVSTIGFDFGAHREESMWLLRGGEGGSR